MKWQVDESLLPENWLDLRQPTLDKLERRYLSAILNDSRGHINMMKRHNFDKRDSKRTPR